METYLERTGIRGQEAIVHEENHLPRIKLEDDPESGALAIVKEENLLMLVESIKDEPYPLVETVDPLQVSGGVGDSKEVADAITALSPSFTQEPGEFCNPTESEMVIKVEGEMKNPDDLIYESSDCPGDFFFTTQNRDVHSARLLHTDIDSENYECVSECMLSKAARNKAGKVNFNELLQQSKIFYDSESIKLKSLSISLENIIPKILSQDLRERDEKCVEDEPCSRLNCQREPKQVRKSLKDLNVCSSRLSGNQDESSKKLVKNLSKGKWYSCTVCPLKYKLKSSLKTHLVKHNQQRSSPFPEFSTKLIPQVDSKTPTTSDLLETSYSYTPCETELISNQQCSMPMPNVNNASTKFKPTEVATKNHQEIRSSQRILSCTRCSAKFTDKKILMRHLITHTEEDPFFDRECQKKEKNCLTPLSKETLQPNSQWRVESEGKWHSCSVCPAKYKLKSSLKIHLAKHRRKGQYQFSEHAAGFGLKVDSQTAGISDLIEKPYLNTLCETGFNAKHPCFYDSEKTKPSDATTKNNKEIRTCQRVLFCFYCSEKFTDKKILKNHLLTHSKEDPSPTSECLEEVTVEHLPKNHVSCDSDGNSWSHPKCQSESLIKWHCCTVCPAKYKLKHSLRLHLAKHCREGLYPFSEYLAKFGLKVDSKFAETPDSNNVNPHSHTHSETEFSTKQPCSNDSTKFEPHVAVIRNHKEIRASRRKLSCSRCSKKFRNKKILGRHLRQHSEEEPLPSTKSPAKEGEPSFMNHLTTSTNEEALSCPQCPFKCKRKASLSMHLYKHADDKPYSCSQCSKKFPLETLLRVHEIIHTSAKPFTCVHCPAKFKRKGDLNVHLKKHSGKAEFACELCSFQFFRRSDFNKHMRSHSNKKLYACSFCPNRYKEKYHLKSHLTTHNNKKKLLSCAHCSCKFQFMHRLLGHLKKHAGVQEYGCSQCSAKFSDSSHLAAHVTTHSSSLKRRFSCAHCSYSCKDKRDMARHIWRVHTSKKFSCEHCAKSFKTSTKLKRHSQISHSES